MTKHTFANWLNREIFASKTAVLALYEKRDRLLYIDGPRIEKQYMEAVGYYEETVIREEIEVELLEKKRQMLQIARNRREPIDLDAIEKAIELERKKMFEEAIGSSAPTEYAMLTEEEEKELQFLYREIVQDFHPQMHKDLTDTHRELFRKAQDAYRRKDLEAMRLVHDMLYDKMSEEELKALLEILAEMNEGTDVENKEAERPDHTTDFSLTKVIYDAFKPTMYEITAQEELKKYEKMSAEIVNEMKEIRSQFPYTATEMLASEEGIAEYKKQLEERLRIAASERRKKTQEIDRILKEVAHG